MSGSPKSARLALFTFDASNTLTVNDPALPSIEFDDENNLVSAIHVEVSEAALQFDCKNNLTSELLPTTPPPIQHVVVEILEAHTLAKANTWPPTSTSCPTCTHPTRPAPTRRPSIFVSTDTSEAVNRHAALLLLIADANAQELIDMKATLKLELASRRPALTVQPVNDRGVDSGVGGSVGGSGTSSAVREKAKGRSRLRAWESNAETANGTDVDEAA